MFGPPLRKRVSVLNEKGMPLFSLHGSARQRNRSGSTTQKGKIRINGSRLSFRPMHLLRSAAPERAYSHRGWEIWANHDLWNCQDCRWNVFAPDEDRCRFTVNSLSDAKAAINEELNPQAQPAT